MLYDAFLDNKYSKWYFDIIHKSLSESKAGCVEKHHIMPKSLGGEDILDNIVSLTAREHYICHLLLTKMTCGVDRRKMSHALWKMVNCQSSNMERHEASSRIYEFARSAHIKSLKVPIEERYGVERAAELKQKMSDAWIDRTTDESRKKISDTLLSKKMRWYNNGVDSKQITEGEQPIGWSLGRMKYLKNTWKWYNDGSDTKRFVENKQPDGWKLGRLRKGW